MKQKFYLYVLQSSIDKNLYIGVTTDLTRRIQEHNSGEQQSTKARGHFELLFYEMFYNKSDAFSREKYFKTGWGRKHLRHVLHHTLESNI